MVDIINTDETWGSIRGKINNVLGGRIANRMAIAGDSRAAAAFIDPSKRIAGGGSGIQWAIALSQQRVSIAGAFGVSGLRTDQILATQLAPALATNAGLLYIYAGLNDIGMDYPTQATSGAAAAANLITMCNEAVRAGMTVILEQEIGSQSIGAIRQVQVMELRQRLREYAERTPRVYLHDGAPTLLDQDASTTVMAFRTGYSYDGVHLNNRGGYYHGKSLLSLINAVVPPRYASVYNTFETPSQGRWQLLPNPLYVPSSGGSVGAGITGTVPASCNVARSGAATATVSVAADPDGFGNNVSMACTFTAAGEIVRLGQDVAIANWSPGDVIEGGALVQVSAPVGFSGAAALLQVNGDSVSYDNAAVFPIDANASQKTGPDEGYTALLVTQPFTVPAMVSKGWCTLHVRATAEMAGSVTLKVLRSFIRRRVPVG